MKLKTIRFFHSWIIIIILLSFIIFQKNLFLPGVSFMVKPTLHSPGLPFLRSLQHSKVFWAHYQVDYLFQCLNLKRKVQTVLWAHHQVDYLFQCLNLYTPLKRKVRKIYWKHIRKFVELTVQQKVQTKILKTKLLISPSGKSSYLCKISESMFGTQYRQTISRSVSLTKRL